MLSIEEDCLYRRLLGQYWRLGKLPSDPGELAELARFPREVFDRAWPRVRPYFRWAKNGLVQKKMASQLRSVKREIGSKREAANIRWNKELHAGGSHPDPYPDLNPDPEDLRSSLSLSQDCLSGGGKEGGGSGGRREKIPPAAIVDFPDGLDRESWEAYQKHRGEIRARKLKPASIERLHRWLLEQGGPDVQRQIVDQTIRNGWTGLFELRANGNGKSRKTSKEARRAALAECDPPKPDGFTIDGECTDGG